MNNKVPLLTTSLANGNQLIYLLQYLSCLVIFYFTGRGISTVVLYLSKR